jgi:hypothetical protein
MTAGFEEIESRIARVLEAYDAQGWHRTGTAVDAASAEWLAESVSETGGESTLEAFSLRRVEPKVGFIETNGRRIEGLPLFDALPLTDGILDGSLGPLGSGSPIGLIVSRSPAPDEHYDVIRRESGHSALVAVTVGRCPGLQARNATRFKSPYGVPVLQVSGEHESFLHAAADSSAPARVAVSTEFQSARSANVVVRVAGQKSNLPPIVVSTPRTGWWNCSGERGGGIACWLEVLRSAIAKPFLREAIFVAFAGHELDHIGLDSFLDGHQGITVEAHAWVHFGANVGAAQGPSVRLSASRADDLELARSALQQAGANEPSSPAAGVVNGGESAVVAGLGARCIALLGGNDRFHLESDRWPIANDVPQTARQARAFSVLVRTIAAQGAEE